MADLCGVFDRQMSDAVDLALAGEAARVHLLQKAGQSAGFRVSRLEYLYEMAYLRMFVAWEVFLEQSFYRYLCGCASATYGLQVPVAGVFFRSTKDAEIAVLGGRKYRLWHSPQEVEVRARTFLVNGRHEIVMTSSATIVGHMAALRHRIAHGQKDALHKCNAATMHFAARRYKGGRPGRFLRDWDRSRLPARRWLETLQVELRGLAGQIS